MPTPFPSSPDALRIGRGWIEGMKILKELIFAIVLITALSVSATAQKQDDKRPPKPTPPVVRPGGDKKPPKESPPPRDDGKRKKPEMAFVVLLNKRGTGIF